jgi:hypothetical protein
MMLLLGLVRVMGSSPVQQAKKMRTIKAFKLRGAVKEGLTSYLVASSHAREIWKREQGSLFARLRDNLLRKCEDHAAKAKSNRLRKKLQYIVWRGLWRFGEAAAWPSSPGRRMKRLMDTEHEYRLGDLVWRAECIRVRVILHM